MFFIFQTPIEMKVYVPVKTALLASFQSQLYLGQNRITYKWYNLENITKHSKNKKIYYH